MTALPAEYDFTVYRGADFSRVITYFDPEGNAIPLDDYTAKMQVRSDAGKSPVFLELSTTNGRIVIANSSSSPTIPEIMISIPAIKTAGLKHSGVYDLILTSPAGFVIPLLAGKFNVIQRVTQ